MVWRGSAALAEGADSTMEVYKLESGKYNVGRCGISRRITDAARSASPGVRAA